ncbi:GH15094 [Drosophila grimshawi]|uniref:GH15094 n=2 Tax=Drosophila grimshawi TaxID=7222 RepID=B4IYV3_DROGR|nr:GH15094 [Drosophila grimshawi]
MAFKFTSAVLLLAAIAAVALAEPAARLRSRSSRFRLARQEAAPPASADDPAVDIAPTPASAPYPPAGVTPAIAFDLPTETETEAQPDLTYGPPDNTYGPPAEPDNTYGPPAEPDNTYGPPADAAADQADLEPIDADPASEPIPARLIQQRNGRLRRRRPVAEKLRSTQIIRSQPILVYTI